MLCDAICIIPAAGKSSRFKELGKAYPKGILPVQGDPIIVKNIRSLQNIGVSVFNIVAKESDLEIFSNIISLYQLSNVNLLLVNETNGSGPLTSLRNGWTDEFKDKNALVVLSDILILEHTLETIRESLESCEDFISFQPESDYSRFCLLRKDGFLDKPKNKENVHIYEELTRGEGYAAASGVYFYTKKRRSLLLDVTSSETKIETQFSDFFGHFITEMKKVRIDVGDFGTLEDYLLNRNISKTSSRAFNSVTMEEGNIIKIGKNPQKILNEYYFLETVPHDLKKFFVRPYGLIDSFPNPGYSMEVITGSNLRERLLLLGMENSEFLEFLNTFLLYSESVKESRKYEGFDVVKFTNSKLLERTNELTNDDDLSYVCHWAKVLSTEVLKPLKSIYTTSSIMHGDCVLSNIFFNNGRLQLVDPNGMFVGSYIYDYAKLYQSIMLDYDFVDMGFYFFNDSEELTILSKGMEEHKKVFLEFLDDNFPSEVVHLIKSIAIALIGSLIPLHSDKRNNQLAYGIIFRNSVQTLLKEETK